MWHTFECFLQYHFTHDYQSTCKYLARPSYLLDSAGAPLPLIIVVKTKARCSTGSGHRAKRNNRRTQSVFLAKKTIVPWVKIVVPPLPRNGTPHPKPCLSPLYWKMAPSQYPCMWKLRTGRCQPTVRPRRLVVVLTPHNEISLSCCRSYLLDIGVRTLGSTRTLLMSSHYA